LVTLHIYNHTKAVAEGTMWYYLEVWAISTYEGH